MKPNISSEKIKRFINRPLIMIAGLFFISRLFYFYIGINFDAVSIRWFWQYIDPLLLKNNLLQSLYYLHSQPPFFNLFLGFVLKLFPGYEVAAFNIIYLIFGLILVLSVFILMIKLGISNRIAVLLTVLFTLSPSCILYENWLFYTYPIAVLLCLSALFLHRFLSKETKLDAFIFFSMLAIISLTRSMFHILWFVLCIIVLISFCRKKWKKILISAAIPFLLIFLCYAKNFYLFGGFSTSSWLGMNLSRITVSKLTRHERNLWVKEKKLSDISLIRPFSPVDSYQKYFKTRQKTQIPVLDQKVRSTGHTNYNNIIYIDISKKYLKDAVSVIKNRPRLYLGAIIGAYSNYFRPSSDYSFFHNNLTKIRRYDRLFNILFYGRYFNDTWKTLDKLGNKDYLRKFFNKGVFLILMFPFLIFYGIWQAAKSLKDKPTNLAFSLTILFLCANILFVTLLGNCLELAENHRFRFMIDPFYLILLGLFLTYRFKKRS